jgi:PAS domain S-box-containing protein
MPAPKRAAKTAKGIDDTLEPLQAGANEWRTATLPLQDIGKDLSLANKELAGALRNLEARLRAIEKITTDSIVTFDQEGIIESVNPAGERLFGYGAAALIGQNVKVLMSPLSRPEEGQLARQGQSEERQVIYNGREVDGRRKDGAIFPMTVWVGRVHDSSLLFTAIFRDMTQQKKLEREVVETAMLEQRRLGQDLHDNCGQELTALGLLTDGLMESLTKTAPAEIEIAKKIQQALKRVLRQVRNISRGLAQVEIDPEGLPAALAELASFLTATSGVRCVFQGGKGMRIEDSVKATHLYHIAQEACTNALKHAKPRNVEICLRTLRAAACSPADSSRAPREYGSALTPHSPRLAGPGDVPLTGGVMLVIQDDGLGMAKDTPEGMGLRIMRSRANVLRARLIVEHVKPHGTAVTCIF